MQNLSLRLVTLHGRDMMAVTRSVSNNFILQEIFVQQLCCAKRAQTSSFKRLVIFSLYLNERTRSPQPLLQHLLIKRNYAEVLTASFYSGIERNPLDRIKEMWVAYYFTSVYLNVFMIPYHSKIICIPLLSPIVLFRPVFSLYEIVLNCLKILRHTFFFLTDNAIIVSTFT